MIIVYKQKFIEDKIENYYNKKSQAGKINKYYNNKAKEKKIIYRYRKLREVRPIYKIINNLSIRINRQMNKLNIKKEFTYTQILGCRIIEFEKYLLEKMQEGMNYENYGKWQVDHIIPFSKFDFTKIEEIIKCCHYTNLQPLWKIDNIKKSNKILHKL